MGKRDKDKPSFKHDWYLQDWMRAMRKAPIDLHKELGWPKAKASDVYTGKQGYSQAMIDEVAVWLGVRPYELLMTVETALGLRHMQEAAREIVGAPAERLKIKGAA